MLQVYDDTSVLCGIQAILQNMPSSLHEPTNIKNIQYGKKLFKKYYLYQMLH